VGDWKITSLGRLRFVRNFDKGHRLLVACNGKSPELWDTVDGQRIAVLYEHRGGLGAAAPSPDGTFFVTAQEIRHHDRLNSGSNAESLWIWRSATGKLVKQINVDLSGENARGSTDCDVDWLSKSKVVLQLHSRDNPARASVHTIFGEVDVESGRVTRMSDPLQISEHLIRSPDEKRAIAGIYPSVTLVDMQAFKIISALDDTTRDSRGEFGSIVKAVWSPDGHRIATVSSTHTVGVWDGFTGKQLSLLEGHADRIVSISFSPDGNKVLTASEDGTARVWDATTRESVTLAGHTSVLADAAFDPTGQVAVTGAEDQTARLWEVRTGKQLFVLANHESGVRRVAFEDDGGRVYTRTAKGIERRWSASDGSLVTEQEPAKHSQVNSPARYGVCFLKERDSITEVWVGPRGATPPQELDRERTHVSMGLLFESDESDTAGMAEPRLTLKGLNGCVQSVALAPSGATLASADLDGKYLLWKPAEWDRITGKGKQNLWRDQKPGPMAFSTDGKMLVTGHPGGVVRVWDVDNCKQLGSMEFRVEHLSSLTFLRNSKIVVVVGYDRTEKLFEAKAREFGGAAERLLAMAKVPANVTASALTQDGQLLAVVYPTGNGSRSDEQTEAVVWMSTSEKEQARLRGHFGLITVLAFTPDGNALVSGGADKTVRVWDAKSGEQRAAVSAGFDAVSSLAISPDGRLVAAGDREGMVRLWSLPAVKECATFRAHPSRSQVTVLVYSGDSKTLVSGSGDGSVKFWDIDKLLADGARK
jgi:WD40 repeat protein